MSSAASKRFANFNARPDSGGDHRVLCHAVRDWQKNWPMMAIQFFLDVSRAKKITTVSKKKGGETE